jgi:hypothetical protein
MNELGFYFRKALLKCMAFLAALLHVEIVVAQDFGSGIDQATSILTSMFDSVSNMALAIAAIVGLIGGVRCYIKWNTGDQDVLKSIMGWGGAVLFFVVVALTIRIFFGI